jgi:hypothetical protein
VTHLALTGWGCYISSRFLNYKIYVVFRHQNASKMSYIKNMTYYGGSQKEFLSPPQRFFRLFFKHLNAQKQHKFRNLTIYHYWMDNIKMMCF